MFYYVCADKIDKAPKEEACRGTKKDCQGRSSNVKATANKSIHDKTALHSLRKFLKKSRLAWMRTVVEYVNQ